MFNLGKLEWSGDWKKKLRGRNLSRWIFAVQVRLFCVTDSGSIVVLCQTEQAEVAIWGGKGRGILFPYSVHSEYRMILLCKAASL